MKKTLKPQNIKGKEMPSNKEKTTSKTINITPTPRILSMLGEINLSPWRCLAEFIDNSIDGFIVGYEKGLNYNPQIDISIPTNSEPGSTITVRDNGPGMSKDKLGKAVKAGWTSTASFDRLGLFGMGFNISTARLGRASVIWSTRKEDEEWIGLEIDFERLIKQGDFNVKVVTRLKIDPEEQGTEVTVYKIKPEQREWFGKGHNRTRLKKKLSDVYSSVLARSNDAEPISVRIKLNTMRLWPHKHCVWGDSRNSEKRSGVKTILNIGKRSVPSFFEIDETLDARKYCQSCWRWLTLEEENVCSDCESEEDVIKRERKVRGWLGIQRYLDENNFGIDFVRNGRKIETKNKDLFVWDDGLLKTLEYPIDDPRGKGRIVGEIHIDHCKVNYSKESFVRLDPAWEEMVHLLKGDGPLRPKVRTDSGFPPINETPLYLLRNIFNRTTPQNMDNPQGWENILAIPGEKKAIVMDYVRRFDKGDDDYQSDEKWWNLIQEHKKELLGKTTEATTGTDSSDVDEDEEEKETSEENGVQRKRILSLCKTIEYENLISWEIEAFEADGDDKELKINGFNLPWVLKRGRVGKFEYVVNTLDEIFKSMTLTPMDALLSELAHKAVDFLRKDSRADTQDQYGEILKYLRLKYISEGSLDYDVLTSRSKTVYQQILKNLKNSFDSEEYEELFNSINSDEQLSLIRRMSAKRISDKTPQSGKFIQFITLPMLQEIFNESPELFFDGKCWDEEYAEVDSDREEILSLQRTQTKSYYFSLLNDLSWLQDYSPDEITTEDNKREVIRAMISLQLLNENLIKSEED